MAGIVRVFTGDCARVYYRDAETKLAIPASVWPGAEQHQHQHGSPQPTAALSSNRSTAAVGGEFLWSVALSLPIRLGLCGKRRLVPAPMMANHQGGDSRKGQRNRQRHEVAGDAQAG